MARDYFPYLIEKSEQGFANALAPLRQRDQQAAMLAELEGRMRREDFVTKQNQDFTLGRDAQRQAAARDLQQGYQTFAADQGDLNRTAADERQQRGFTHSENQAQAMVDRETGMNEQIYKRSLISNIQQHASKYQMPMPSIPPSAEAGELEQMLGQLTNQTVEQIRGNWEKIRSGVAEYQTKLNALRSVPQEQRQEQAIVELIKSQIPSFNITDNPDGSRSVSMSPEAAKANGLKRDAPLSEIIGTLGITQEALANHMLMAQAQEQRSLEQQYSRLNQAADFNTQRFPTFDLGFDMSTLDPTQTETPTVNPNALEQYLDQEGVTGPAPAGGVTSASPAMSFSDPTAGDAFGMTRGDPEKLAAALGLNRDVSAGRFDMYQGMAGEAAPAQTVAPVQTVAPAVTPAPIQTVAPTQVQTGGGGFVTGPNAGSAVSSSAAQLLQINKQRLARGLPPMSVEQLLSQSIGATGF